MRCWIGGVAILGPGLPGWAASEAVLAGTRPWQMEDVAPPAPALLPATERRRASASVRFALAAATEATASDSDRSALETVFASGNGDGAVIVSILDALHNAEGAVSPTQFHNSVHNAAAGYWHISVGSIAASVSVGGHDAAFASGLLTAATAVAARSVSVLLCAYDTPMPPPLAAVRRTDFAFSAGFVLRPAPDAASRAALDLRYVASAAPEPVQGDLLDALAAGNAAARTLPLLRALARRGKAMLHLPLCDDAHLELHVTPC